MAIEDEWKRQSTTYGTATAADNGIVDDCNYMIELFSSIMASPPMWEPCSKRLICDVKVIKVIDMNWIKNFPQSNEWSVFLSTFFPL